MPLTQDQIRQRRNMSPEASRNQDLFRTAESLERIATALEDIRDAYLFTQNRQPTKHPE